MAELQTDPDVQARINDLAEKANEGQLTEAEAPQQAFATMIIDAHQHCGNLSKCEDFVYESGRTHGA